MGATETDITRPGVARPDAGSPPPSPSPARRAATSIGLLALVASALLGGNPFGLRERLMGSATPEARPAAASRAAGEAPVASTMEPQETVLRSQPWWQSVATLEGNGATNPEPFTIDDGAIQWRVTSSCQSGTLTVTAAVGGSDPLVEAGCPGTGEGYSSDNGPTRLAVEADGPWQLQVEQQLDVPLVEPPTAAMTDPTTTVASTGSFYRMDQSGTGTVSIYRLDDGTHTLRLDEFFVTPNVDLEIYLSPLEAPQTTEEFMSVSSVSVAPLDVTAGSMNFVIPPEVDPAQYASVVIWCPLIDSAYAAATLTPAS